MKKINFGSSCWFIAVDTAQILTAVGSGENEVTFIETSKFTKVKKMFVGSNRSMNSLAFKKRSDCLLGVPKDDFIQLFKFWSLSEVGKTSDAIQ